MNASALQQAIYQKSKEGDRKLRMVTALQYEITEQDFVDYNMYFIDHDPITQRNIQKIRWMMAGMVAIGGTVLMYMIDALNLVTVLIYLLLAVGCFFLGPAWVKRNARKNVHRTIQNASNKHICGQKTLRLNETGVQLIGENEDSTYSYDAFRRVTMAQNQVYLYLDDISALIVPNHAFSTAEQKEAFVHSLEQRIAQAKRNAPPSEDVE